MLRSPSRDIVGDFDTMCNKVVFLRLQVLEQSQVPLFLANPGRASLNDSIFENNQSHRLTHIIGNTIKADLN